MAKRRFGTIPRPNGMKGSRKMGHSNAMTNPSCASRNLLSINNAVTASKITVITMRTELYGMIMSTTMSL